MKPIFILPPLVALIVAAVWLHRQQNDLALVRDRIAEIRKNFPLEKFPQSIGTSIPDRSKDPVSTTAKGKINWSRIADLFGERRKGIFAKQEILRFNARVEAMSPDELIAALEEVGSMDMDIRSRSEIQKKLISSLGEKDPAAALDHLVGNASSQVSLLYDFQTGILSKWLKSDPSAAEAWLDESIAAGKLESKMLDGTNNNRLFLETAMLSHLLGSDRAAAIRRISALPENQRMNIVLRAGDSLPSMDGNHLDAYIALIRGTLNQEEQLSTIPRPVSELASQRGYEKIDAYLEQSAATPDERTTAVGLAAATKFKFLAKENRLNPEGIDTFRAWAATQAPDKVDWITAQALKSVSYSGANAIENASAMALHYFEQTGNDDILVMFASHLRDKEKGLAMATRIKDEAKRAQVVATLNNNPFGR